MIEIRVDDLTGEPTHALLALHLAGMHASSPPCTVFALDLSGLRAPGITVWSAWIDGQIAGIGALKRLCGGQAEIKSMRTHPDHLRKGVARHMLRHIVAQARGEGLTRLSLETGTGPDFEPAVALYRAHGFVSGPAFNDYEASAFNQFLHLALQGLEDRMTRIMAGGCQCRRIRYEARLASDEAYLCHCNYCRRATGGVSIAFVNVAQADVTWTGDAPDYFQSSPIARRPFCATCGTPLGFQFLDSANMDLTVGSFDDPAYFRPTSNFSVETMLPQWSDTSHLPGKRLDEHPAAVDRWMKTIGKLPD